jgi:hypothetical protein
MSLREREREREREKERKRDVAPKGRASTDHVFMEKGHWSELTLEALQVQC